MSATRIKTNILADVKALMRLSDFSGKGVTPQRIARMVKKSPDPETIVQLFLGEMPIESEVLRRKWRKIIQRLWAESHPGLPYLPQIPITKQAAASTPVLLDALGVVSALSDAPASLARGESDSLISAADSRRLAGCLESLAGLDLPLAERQADVPGLSRLLTCLSAADLIEPRERQLRVNHSRLRRFLDLPRSYQFYLLWHCDVYHVNWGDFAARWQDCLHDIQEYLPLLWEVSEADSGSRSIDKQAWCIEVAEAYAPLWQGHLRHGLLQAISSVGFFVHQASLAATVNQLILNDLFARYGLIQFEADGNFVWTPLGVALLAAEAEQKLPCGLELLK